MRARGSGCAEAAEIRRFGGRDQIILRPSRKPSSGRQRRQRAPRGAEGDVAPAGAGEPSARTGAALGSDRRAALGRPTGGGPSPGAGRNGVGASTWPRLDTLYCRGSLPDGRSPRQAQHRGAEGKGSKSVPQVRGAPRHADDATGCCACRGGRPAAVQAAKVLRGGTGSLHFTQDASVRAAPDFRPGLAGLVRLAL